MHYAIYYLLAAFGMICCFIFMVKGIDGITSNKKRSVEALLTFTPSQDTNTVAVEFDGKARLEDALKLDKIIQEKFSEKGKFNIYAVIDDLDDPTIRGIIEGMKMDLSRWNHFEKLAVISEKNWSNLKVKLEELLSDIDIKHFKMEEMHEAWDWIQKSGKRDAL